jgi:tyrosinase
MSSYTRKNAWNNDGTFDNPDLLWYAKGVGVMMSRALDDPNSWWFFAAIHGEYITIIPDPKNPKKFPYWGDIPSPPQVPTAPLPAQNLIDLYWNQCQHGSWYFVPWHRGYLLALEEQIRAAVVGLGGPSNWALPYWNYFGAGDEYKIPPAFTERTLPDKTANPLFVQSRYGPKFDGNVFVLIGPSDENENCQKDNVYTNKYGGAVTKFQHSPSSRTDFGDLESNPHNGVHMDVGGYQSSTDFGLMSDPGIAALDPVFYLHHSNIDRMWAAWNDNGNSNPTDPNWVNGPASSGDRKFAMPFSDGTSWVYTPADVNSLNQLDYSYDDLSLTSTPRLFFGGLKQRLMKLGTAPEAAQAAAGAGENMDEDNAELVGTHDGNLRITSSGARVNVRLDSAVRQKVSASLAAASAASPPDRVYLRLDNVRGKIDATKLYVYVNQQPVGHAALFGLRRASLTDGEHGGQGLSFVLDITDVIDNLFVDNSLDTEALDVRIVPNHAVPDEEELTVEQISIYREGQQ